MKTNMWTCSQSLFKRWVLPVLGIVLICAGLIYVDKGLELVGDTYYYLNIAYLIHHHGLFLKDYFDYRLPVLPWILSPLFGMNLSMFGIYFCAALGVYSFYGIVLFGTLKAVVKQTALAWGLAVLGVITAASHILDYDKQGLIIVFHHSLEWASVYLVFTLFNQSAFKTMAAKRLVWMGFCAGFLGMLGTLGRQSHIFPEILFLGFFLKNLVWDRFVFKLKKWWVACISSGLGGLVAVGIVGAAFFHKGLTIDLIKMWMFDLPSAYYAVHSDVILGGVKWCNDVFGVTFFQSLIPVFFFIKRVLLLPIFFIYMVVKWEWVPLYCLVVASVITFGFFEKRIRIGDDTRILYCLKYSAFGLLILAINLFFVGKIVSVYHITLVTVSVFFMAALWLGVQKSDEKKRIMIVTGCLFICIGGYSILNEGRVMNHLVTQRMAVKPRLELAKQIAVYTKPHEAIFLFGVPDFAPFIQCQYIGGCSHDFYFIQMCTLFANHYYESIRNELKGVRIMVINRQALDYYFPKNDHKNDAVNQLLYEEVFPHFEIVKTVNELWIMKRKDVVNTIP